MLTIDIITIFPDMVRSALNESIVKRAQIKKKIKICVHDLRLFANNKHKKVDDRPFGGGPGMVLSVQPIVDAVKKIKGKRKAKVILTCPSGKLLTQSRVKKLAKVRNLIIVCGHYEGVDERVRSLVVDESLSIGDYILTGGEIPAIAIVDAVTRLVPGVLGKEESLAEETFENNLVEYPQYTRPEKFGTLSVPKVLLSGNHQEIRQWRKNQAIARTKKLRPDLAKKRKEK